MGPTQIANDGRIPQHLRKPARPVSQCQTELHTWFERDRAHVELRDQRTEQTIVEWWDADVSQALEDGFLDARNYHSSAYEYAKSVNILPMVSPHFISGSGSGSLGCLYDHCAVHRTYADAVSYVESLFDLGRTRTVSLKRSACLDLRPGKDGADYAEITVCGCASPWDHDDNVTEEDWNSGLTVSKDGSVSAGKDGR
jgi:hypothetical protein